MTPPRPEAPSGARFFLRTLAWLPALSILASCGQSAPTDPGNTPTNPVAPAANFTSAPSGSNPLTILFTDTSTPGSAPVTAWSWSFGDGGTSTTQNPSHTYAAAGSFNVSLAVTTSVGSNSRAAFVNPTAPPVAPTANFTSTTQTGTDPLVVTFTDTSVPGSSAITSWVWDFGDGTSGTQQNPVHTYSRGALDQKFFEVKLTVTTTAGSNTKTSTNHVEVYNAIIIDAPAQLLGGVSTVYNTPNTVTSLTATADPIRTLREFRPVLDSAVVTMWEGSYADNDCYTGANWVAKPATQGTGALDNGTHFRGWLRYIPHRTGESTRWLERYTAQLSPAPGDTWPGSNGSATNFANMRTLLQVSASTATGSTGRWVSCEEMKPLFSNYYTIYKISTNQPVQQLARIRKYRYYRPIPDGFFPLGEQTGTVQRTATNTRGVSNTKSFEFSASISASVTSETPGMNATLESTLTSTYGFSTTVHVEQSVGVTYNSPDPKQNYELQWALWEEVEVYRIEGLTPGVLWSDPNYAVRLPSTQLELVNQTATVVQSAVWVRKPGT